MVGLDREDLHDPARSHPGAGQLVDELRRRAQRHREERRVPVEGHQLTGGDLPGDGQVGADAGDHDDEDPRQQHLGGIQRRLHRRESNPGETHPLRLRRIPGEEGVLAADAAQHAQPGDGVGTERRELPGSSRWACWRRCSGRTTRASDASSSGPPTSMMTPSSTELARGVIAETTMKLTIAPARRAVTSKTSPMRQKSLAKLVTTCPAGICRVTAGPPHPARSVTTAVRNDDTSQLRTANQCRPFVVTARSPRPMIAAAHVTSARGSRATSPSSTALPMAAGTKAIGEHPRHAEEHPADEGAPLVPGQPQDEAVGVQRRGCVGGGRVGPGVEGTSPAHARAPTPPLGHRVSAVT